MRCLNPVACEWQTQDRTLHPRTTTRVPWVNAYRASSANGSTLQSPRRAAVDNHQQLLLANVLLRRSSCGLLLLRCAALHVHTCFSAARYAGADHTTCRRSPPSSAAPSARVRVVNDAGHQRPECQAENPPSHHVHWLQVAACQYACALLHYRTRSPWLGISPRDLRYRTARLHLLQQAKARCGENAYRFTTLLPGFTQSTWI